MCNVIRLVNFARMKKVTAELNGLLPIALAYSVSVPPVGEIPYEFYNENVKDSVDEAICEINELQVIDVESVIAQTATTWKYRADSLNSPQHVVNPIVETLSDDAKAVIDDFIKICSE